MHEDTRERPLRELFSRLFAEAERIFNTDLALVRTELKERMTWLKLGAGLMLGGVFFMLLGVLALAATVIIAISYALPAWLSALIVGLFLFIMGGSLALVGLRRLGRADWAPRQTIGMLKEEGTWLREKLA